MAETKMLAGVVGFFDNAEDLIEATRKTRDSSYKRFDAFTPYPVHGLEAAQGLKRSPIPFVTFAAGLTGGTLGFLLQYWTSAVDWPLNVGGKPFNSWPAFIPVTFEVTVLFAALATFGAMLLFNGLPNTKRKAFDPSITNNRFALLIEAPVRDPHEDDEDDEDEPQRFDQNAARQFLSQVGAKDVREVYTEAWF